MSYDPYTPPLAELERGAPLLPLEGLEFPWEIRYAPWSLLTLEARHEGRVIASLYQRQAPWAYQRWWWIRSGWLDLRWGPDTPPEVIRRVARDELVWSREGAEIARARRVEEAWLWSCGERTVTLQADPGRFSWWRLQRVPGLTRCASLQHPETRWEVSAPGWPLRLSVTREGPALDPSTERLMLVAVLAAEGLTRLP